MFSLLENLSTTNGHILVEEENGVIVACFEYDWVKNAEDMLRADKGIKPVGGNILYISNIYVKEGHGKSLLKLRHKLPPHRWIMGLTDDWKIKAPKGIPDGFFNI